MKKTDQKSGNFILAGIVSVFLLLNSCTFSKDRQKVSSKIDNYPPNETESAELKLVNSWDAMVKEPNQNKKWWLLPIYFVFVILSFFLLMVGGGSVLPAIFAIF
jgi:hypothetical protein